jgi:hypothetical protein
MKAIDEKDKKYNDRCIMAVNMIANSPELIPLLKNKYTTDDVLEDALDLNPDIFKFIKDPSDRIIAKALDMDGANIQYISKERLQSIPEELILSAIESVDDTPIDFGIDFDNISEESRLDIFMQDPAKALQCGITVPEYFIINAIQKTPNIIRYVKDPTNKMKCIALNLEPNVVVYFDSLTDEMMDIIDAKYPYLKELSTYTRKGGNK